MVSCKGNEARRVMAGLAEQGHYQQGHSPTVTEQGEQSRFGDGNQSQPRDWCLPDKSVVMKKSESQARLSSQQGKLRISKVQNQAQVYLCCYSSKD